MKYTFQVTIEGDTGQNGTIRIATVGGSPDQLVGDPAEGYREQLGLNLPPRYGLVQIRPINDSTDILSCVATLHGYNNRPVENVRVPGHVQMELPCSVTITGPVGTVLIVEAWPAYSGGNERGAAKSFLQPQALTPVPIWATTFDFSGIMGTGVIEFFNSLGASVGIVTAQIISNFSVPDGAATFTLTTGVGGFVVFRQQG